MQTNKHENEWRDDFGARNHSSSSEQKKKKYEWEQRERSFDKLNECNSCYANLAHCFETFQIKQLAVMVKETFEAWKMIEKKRKRYSGISHEFTK